MNSSGVHAITSDLIDFKFPVIGFTPDRDIWGFPDRRSLTTCSARALRQGAPVGMDLIDAEGAQFRVAAVHNKGRASALAPWLVSALLAAGGQYRIEYSLVPLEKASLDEVKARARESIETFPDYYCQEDEQETVLLPLLAALQAADDVAEFFTLLALDTFEAC